jgi:hypothetical protein
MTNSSRIRKLDTDIWIVHGSDIVFAGAAMHTRMTVVRLSDGGLWLHSPIEMDDEVAGFIKDLGGQVAALVAPNKFHHLFVADWRQAYPAAVVLAETHLMKKVPGLADAVEITDAAPELYSGDIEQQVIRGNRMFEEAVFFHKPSKTLILTDLMINLPIEHLSGMAKLFLRFEGVVYPNGGIPRLYRWLTTNRSNIRQAAERMLDWAPDRIVFSHGEIFEEGAVEVLQREFAYVLS